MDLYLHALKASFHQDVQWEILPLGRSQWFVSDMSYTAAGVLSIFVKRERRKILR